MQRTNVYAGVKGQILKGFSNVPKILQAYPMAEAVLGARCPSSRYEYRAPIQRSSRAFTWTKKQVRQPGGLSRRSLPERKGRLEREILPASSKSLWTRLTTNYAMQNKYERSGGQTNPRRAIASSTCLLPGRALFLPPRSSFGN
jgi:hypothetical protein